jgi:hypothetical protein
MSEQTVNIDGEDFAFSELEQDAQVMIQRVQQLREVQQNLQIQLIENERSIAHWETDIRNSIKPVETEESASLL